MKWLSISLYQETYFVHFKTALFFYFSGKLCQARDPALSVLFYFRIWILYIRDTRKIKNHLRAFFGVRNHFINILPQMHAFSIFVYITPICLRISTGLRKWRRVLYEGNTCKTRGRPEYQPQAIGYIFHAIVKQDETFWKQLVTVSKNKKHLLLGNIKERGYGKCPNRAYQ